MVLRSSGTVVGLSLGVVLLILYVRTLSWALGEHSYNVWGSLIVTPLVIMANAALLWWACSQEESSSVRRVFVFGFAAKMIGTLGRYVVAFLVYDGVADATGYNNFAAAHYGQWRTGAFVWEWAGKQGTQYMELITTAVYTVIGPAPMAGFFVFSSFAFWGAYLIYRAFVLALPGADRKRYALLLFLLPSMLYWPSSIGKEAWLMLFVGVTAYGAAQFFTRRVVPGLIWMAAGFVGTAVIRPHVTVLMVAALFVAQVVRPTTKRSTSILTKAAGAVVMGIAGVILTTASASFLGIDDLSWQAVSESVDWSSGQTAQGGSAFTPVPMTSPMWLPAAIGTLLFRPFPWEADNPQLLLQSLEGLLLIVLTIAAWPRLKALPRLLRRSPYLVFAVVYSLAFIVAFSAFANFGILARQRVLMLPFFLVLLALPKPPPAPLRSRYNSPEVLIGARW